MDFLTFIYAYLGTTLAFIFVLLFGDAPWAAGTPLSTARWLLAEAWVDALAWGVNKVFGVAGLRRLDAAAEVCCERSNPALQIAYLIIWSGGYALYWQYVFRLMPNARAPTYHLYTGTACLCLTLCSFLAASASHPGAVTSHNAAAYLAAYPPDGLLFPPKLCPTCQLPRPGRSKHCGMCGSCVPRFDHHCGWVNTCVGLHNTASFLAFLAANLTTCAYALWLAVAVLRGELGRRGMLELYVYDPVQRQRVPIYHKPARLLELLVVYYPVQVALCLFISVGGLLLAAFLLYQVYLISTGCTTYESFKRNQVHKEQREQAQAAAAAEAAAAVAAGYQQQQHEEPQQQEQLQDGSKHSRAQGDVAVKRPPAPYDRGFWSNWFEVLRPQQFLQAAAAARHEAGAAAAAANGAGHARAKQQ